MAVRSTSQERADRRFESRRNCQEQPATNPTSAAARIDPLPIDAAPTPAPPDPVTRDIRNGTKIGITNAVSTHNTAQIRAETMPTRMLLM